MLEVRDLHVYHGRLHALHGLSLAVARGEIACLLGANGAGKSTTLLTISGIHRARIGTIAFDGAPIHDLAPERIVRRGLVQVPEGRRIFPSLSVRENLLLGGYARGGGSDAFDHALELFPRLGERLGQPGGSLSGGEQQMLAIGRALMAGPRMLLLDEPSLGLAPLIIEQIFATIRRIADEGIAILLVEQNAAAALELADHGYVIENGRLAMADQAGRLRDDPRLREAYLGG